jgi:putative restriction endonuclease
MDGINQEERAAKAWPVLSDIARKRALITYKQLGDDIGVHHRAIRYVLDLIQTHCLENHLPPMTILVVNGDSGRPGDGFIAWDADDIDSGLRKVYARNWDVEENPFGYAISGLSRAELSERIVSDPSNAADVYRLVKHRGVVQQIFRDALLSAYDGACAFCGLTFEDALEGAHIVAWSEASRHQKMAPSNGLLLCSTHHRLFDTGHLVVGPDGTIVYCDPQLRDGPYTEADRHASVMLHGQRVRVPRDIRHRTSADVWSWRYKHQKWNQAPWNFK